MQTHEIISDSLENSFQKLENQLLRGFVTDDFDSFALQIFQLQAKHNPIYKKYLDLLGVEVENIRKIENIPFLPIQFFKNYEIKTGNWKTEKQYSSSGTTGQTTSSHAVKDENFCHKIAKIGFENRYGSLQNYAILGLLPSYLERNNSSLVSMVDYFISESKQSNSGFFLDDFDKLFAILAQNKQNNIPTLLIGVSFALVDFSEKYKISDANNLIIMETGGMKGRRKELTKSELHTLLMSKFSTQQIDSEYGMTELFSQAYSKGAGVFVASPTMKILIREVQDPLTLQGIGKTGAINVIDLANLHTCSFIATEDVGKIDADGNFELLGRLDASDIRGCNLMVE